MGIWGVGRGAIFLLFPPSQQPAGGELYICVYRGCVVGSLAGPAEIGSVHVGQPVKERLEKGQVFLALVVFKCRLCDRHLDAGCRLVEGWREELWQ